MLHRLFLMGACLVAACGSEAPPAVDSRYPIDCVQRINDFRATLELEPLARWEQGERCADRTSQTDSETSIAHGSFGECGEFAQNTCPGWPSFDGVIDGCLQAMWDEGEPPMQPCSGSCFQAHGHYLTMSSTRYREVACGFYEMPDGSVWSNQNFR